MKVSILGTFVDNITKEKAFDTFFEFMQSDKVNTVFTPNAEICMEAYHNHSFQEVLNHASLVIPDGQGVILASKILKSPLKEKVAGFKLILSVFESGHPVSCYLFGSKPGVSDKAINLINQQYKNVTVKGHHHGYFKEEEIPSIISDINESGASFLLVGLGAPKQEFFIDKYRDQLHCSVIMGVGGSIDVLAEEVIRTPEIFVKLSLEWFHRLLTQPKRFKRMLRIPLFLLICFKHRLLKL